MAALEQAFLQTILNYLLVFSSREMQLSIWIRNDHPRRYVSSYDDATETFHEFVGWLLEDDSWKEIGLNDEQIADLKKFYAELMSFDRSLPDRHSAFVVRDSRWPRIVSHAGGTLAVMLKNTQGLKPQLEMP